MPTHVWQSCPSFNRLMVNIVIEAISGVRLTKAKKLTVAREARGPESNKYRAKPAKNVKAPSANSEIGTPPQSDSLNSAEYGLYMAARQASASEVAGAPGMNEQWTS